MYLTHMAHRHSRWQIAQADYALDQVLGQESSEETIAWVYCPEPVTDTPAIPEWLEKREHDANILYAREIVMQERSRGREVPFYWLEIASMSTQKEKSLWLKTKAFFARRRWQSEMMRFFRKLFRKVPQDPIAAQQYYEEQNAKDQELFNDVTKPDFSAVGAGAKE